MALHPQIAAALSAMPALPPGPIDPELLRAAEEAAVPPLESRPRVAVVEDRVLMDGDRGLRLRIYRATDAPSPGAVVYLHGGAYFLGSLETHDHVARSLAAATGLAVVAVDYRRAPEAAFPAALEDALTALAWVADQPELCAADDGVLALAGDSSGGGLAAAAAALAHDQGLAQVTHQVLYYPSVDLDFDVDRYDSLVENAQGYGLETAGLRPFNAFYFDSGADPADPRVSPIKRDDLAGLPPALIITAEHDPLRDEGERYGERLRAAGVRAEIHRYPGAIHGFVANFGSIPEYAAVFAETADFLQGRA